MEFRFCSGLPRSGHVLDGDVRFIKGSEGLIKFWLKLGRRPLAKFKLVSRYSGRKNLLTQEKHGDDPFIYSYCKRHS
jgi:hypothetical protein